MILNFQATVKLLSRFSWEKICPHWTVWIKKKKKKSDACNVQSDLDLHCTQKDIMSRLAVQGLIHPKLKNVLSVRSMVVL